MLVFYGNMSISDGVNTTKNNVGFLGSLVGNIYDDGESLGKHLFS